MILTPSGAIPSTEVYEARGRSVTTFVRLYAWAVPAFTAGSPVDHTWVTSYDNRSAAFGSLGQVTAAKQFYWLCWGNSPSPGSISRGGRGRSSLRSVFGRTECEFSRTVVAARGTILRYGRDGVCPSIGRIRCSIQLAVTTSKRLQSRTRVVISSSSFRYGTYGLNQDAWKDKRNSCGIAASSREETAGADR